MKTTQALMDELHNLNPKWEIRISYTYQKYADGIMTPYLIIIFGMTDWNDNWNVGYINKNTGEMKISDEFLDKDIYYECFEGGYEEDLNECLIRLILNIKKYQQQKKKMRNKKL